MGSPKPDKESVERRFWSRVSNIGKEGCWEWTASRTKKGYGRFGICQDVFGAHVVSWTLKNGEVPPGHNVLHKCDNPPCVRPDHLWTGTPLQNTKDALEKGRLWTPFGKAGKRQPNTTPKDTVYEIRARWMMGEKQKEIAESIGVHKTTVNLICNYKARQKP